MREIGIDKPFQPYETATFELTLGELVLIRSLTKLLTRNEVKALVLEEYGPKIAHDTANSDAAHTLYKGVTAALASRVKKKEDE